MEMKQTTRYRISHKDLLRIEKRVGKSIERGMSLGVIINGVLDELNIDIDYDDN